MIPAPLLHTRILILDSNVVFDWLLFQDPATTCLARAITNGTVRWVGTQEMVDEAEHVLARGDLQAWAHRHEGLRAMRTRWLHIAPSAQDSLAAHAHPDLFLRCTDPDDQKFIDLALCLPATWLVTRDKALLRLRRRAALAGVVVVEPADWELEAASE